MRYFAILSVLPLFLACSCPQIETLKKSKQEILDQIYKDRLIEVAARVYARELTSGTGGDISVRVPGTERIIVKATGTCLGDLDYEKLSTINLEGEVIGGNPAPSHEADIHAAIYSMRDTVGAIMHMHAPYSTAWATAGKIIPAVTQQSVKPLEAVAIVPYYRVGSPELVQAVVEAYRNPGTSVVMMENHGAFVVGSDLYDLLYKAEVVENTARIAWLCNSLGEPKEFEF
jgi:L-ribulose-5-phosphate 4-epimerase